MKRVLVGLFVVAQIGLYSFVTWDTPVEAQSTSWVCSVDDAGAALTLCRRGVTDRSLAVTQLTVASTTGTAGQILLAYGHGPNCAYGTLPLFPRAAYVPRIGYADSTQIRFRTPLIVPRGEDLCVLATATNTAAVQVAGVVSDGPTSTASTWTPADLLPWGWWEADSIVQGDGSDITAVQDYSRNDHDLASSVGAYPTFEVGEQHGLPVMRFAAGQFLGVVGHTNFLGTDGAGTVAVVVNPSSADTEYVWRGAAATPLAYLAWLGSAGPALWACANDGSLVCAQAVTAAGPQMVVWSKAPTTVSIGINDWDDAALTSQTAGTLGTLTGEFILSDWSGGSPGALGFKGDIAAAFVINRTLTQEERRRLADYWLRKWFGQLSGDTTRPSW